MNAVLAGGRSQIDDRIADALSRRRCDFIHMQDADAHRIHQRISAVFRMKVDFAAYGWHSDAVAIPADARDDMLEEIAIPLHDFARSLAVLDRSKPKRIEARDRTRPHREDVAD